MTPSRLALPSTAAPTDSSTPKSMPLRDVIEAAPNVLDVVSKKSERWWFFTLLVIGIGWTGFIHWQQQEQLSLRDQKIDRLEEKMTTMLQNVVMDNTKAMVETTAVLRRVETELLRNSPR